LPFYGLGFTWNKCPETLLSQQMSKTGAVCNELLDRTITAVTHQLPQVASNIAGPS